MDVSRAESDRSVVLPAADIVPHKDAADCQAAGAGSWIQGRSVGYTHENQNVPLDIYFEFANSFPWESAFTGVRVTQPCCPAVAQYGHHITGDISFALRVAKQVYILLAVSFKCLKM